MARHAILILAAGDKDAHAAQVASHEALTAFFKANGSAYGLVSNSLADLDDEQRETLKEAYSQLHPDAPFVPDAPASLAFPPLHILLTSSPGLAKTVTNFTALCTGDRGLQKKAPFKPYHYKGTPIHRIEKGFVIQGGDITRGDGSGGDSIYGGPLPLEKPGLKPSALDPPITWGIGTLAMASSGSGKATSQFFVCLTDAPVQLKKLDGKYVAFGQVVGPEGWKNVLKEVEERGGGGEKVWVEDCGIEDN